MKSSRNIVAIPMGDPSGIGPEIVIKALKSEELRMKQIIVVGDKQVFKKFCDDYSYTMPFEHIVTEIDELLQVIPTGAKHLLYDMKLIEISSFRYNEIQKLSGMAAYESIKMCVEFANRKIVGAIATPPLHKEALKMAGVSAIGHTEIFGELTQSPHPITMFKTHALHIFFMTRHLSLRDACDAVTKEGVYEFIKSVNRITEHNYFPSQLPLAIAALNPHGGEGGLFGDEEITSITPAIRRAQREGIDIVGPIGADSVFHLAKIGRYKAVLSLYHDQGHIAAKTLDFDRTVSVTWLLPFIRTSVDHGTAFDIAGKNIASEVSMIEAIKVAFQYIEHEEITI